MNKAKDIAISAGVIGLLGLGGLWLIGSNNQTQPDISEPAPVEEYQEIQDEVYEDGYQDYLYSMPDKDCWEFSSQQEAQELYEQYSYDYHNLDGDSDGYACETLP